MYLYQRPGLGGIRESVSRMRSGSALGSPPSAMAGFGERFNEPPGKPEPKPCWEIWTVWGFNPNSSKLLDFQKKHIKDIATHIVSKLGDEVKGKVGTVHLSLFYEGHVDKNTDPKQYGKLDVERANEVSFVLQNQILDEWGKRFPRGLATGNKLSGVGSTRPFNSDPKKNRRVVVCARWELRNP